MAAAAATFQPRAANNLAGPVRCRTRYPLREPFCPWRCEPMPSLSGAAAVAEENGNITGTRRPCYGSVRWKSKSGGQVIWTLLARRATAEGTYLFLKLAIHDNG